MKFGIIETQNGHQCVNCGKKLTQSEAKGNYCPHCGAPLTPRATENFLNLEKEIQKDVVLQIEEMLKENSIEKIVSDLKQQFKA